MARSAGPRPRGLARHASSALPASTTCKTGASAASRTVPSPSSSRAENAVALRTMSKGSAAISLASGATAASSLRLVTYTAVVGETLPCERLGHSLDRRAIVGEIDRAVEDDERARRAGRSATAGPLETPERRDRRGRRRLRRPADQGREIGEARAEIIGAALVEIAPDAVQRLGRERRGRLEPPIGAAVARKKRELDAAPSRQRRQFVDAVAPVVGAAEHAGDDQLRLRAHALAIEIDRIGVAQRRETGEPQRRLRRLERRVGAGQRIEVAVGKGQDDDVRRRLAEIDRFDRFVERAELYARDMHRGALSGRRDGHPLLREAGKVAEGRMGCGKQV